MAGARITPTEAAPKERLDKEIIDAMVNAGVRPAIIYAYRATGLWITDINRAVHSEAELAAWDAAIDEFNQDYPEDDDAQNDSGTVPEDPSVRQAPDQG